MTIAAGCALLMGCGVAVIDAVTRQVVSVIEDVGTRPWGIGVSPDGKRLFTANGPSNDVSIIDVDTGTVIKRVKVGELPLNGIGGRSC